MKAGGDRSGLESMRVKDKRQEMHIGAGEASRAEMKGNTCRCRLSFQKGETTSQVKVRDLGTDVVVSNSSSCVCLRGTVFAYDVWVQDH